MSMYVVRISLFILIGVIYTSCITQSVVLPASSGYATEGKRPEDIIERFVTENPIEALTLSQQFARRALISKDVARHFVDAALVATQDHVQKFYDEADYARAWIEAENARIVGAQITEQLRYDIVMKRIEHFIEQNNYMAIIRAVNQLERLVTAEMKKRPAYQSMLDEREKVRAYFPPVQHKRSAVPPMEDLLNSTFIVDINNGIQIAADGSGPHIARGIGSAFFITTDGYAITNYHVIRTEVDPEYEGLSEMKARLPVDDFTTRPARVVGYDEVLDLALIKVPFSPSYAFSLQTPHSNIGDAVVAIGSPLGLSNTVTSGIISGKDRAGILSRGGVFQIDASINSGNSGGPVVDEKKNLLGVVFSKVDEIAEKKFEGLGFAIPSDMVNMVLARLFDGKVEHAWLGLGVFEVTRGLEVAYIHPNSTINRSALRIGDVITHINGNTVSKIVDAQKLLIKDAPHKLYALKVIPQDNKKNTVQFSLKHSKKIYEEAEAKEMQRQDENSNGIEDEPLDMFVQSIVLGKDIIKPQSKATLHTVFPILTGAQIEVTRYSSFRPIYRVTRVLPDTLAEYIRLSSGDLIAIRSIRQHRNTMHVVIQVLQQSRGYLNSTLVLTVSMDASNFI